jgi:uncharacterized protein (TIGR03000 family)
VRLPANAELWFDGSATTSTGLLRAFESPALAPGRRYTYTIRARWQEEGREIMQSRQVLVTAGARVRADFATEAATTAQRKAP